MPLAFTQEDFLVFIKFLLDERGTIQHDKSTSHLLDQHRDLFKLGPGG